jgi:predicted nucleic acid-binding protein
LSTDFEASFRRLRPQRRSKRPTRRPDTSLKFLETAAPGPPLLLDTTVYVDQLQGKGPQELAALLSVRLVNHSSIAVGEIAHVLGRLDPQHSGTPSTVRSVMDLIDRLPPHRLTSPSIRAQVEAGMLSGLVDRLRGDGKSILNDAALYLQAIENGWLMLTRNVSDFDLLQQLVPSGDVLFYRHG